MEIRSFLAFELPVEIKRIISEVSEDAKRLPLDVRWVSVANIHLTIVFLGNVEEGQLTPMGEVVGNLCRGYKPFSIQVKGTGFFGGRRNPRVFWVGLGGDIERMSYFRDDLQKDLRPFGIKEEKRRYRPHLTLGRFRKGARPERHLSELLSKQEALTSPNCALKELVLFKSDLGPDGAVYSKLNKWPLAGKQ